VQQKAFGRRPGVVSAPRHVESARREPVFADPLPAMGAAAAMDGPSPELPFPELSLDDELDVWKAERRRDLGLLLVPWRPLYLIASLSFGIASFALPDSINAWADWLLYGLAAASLLVWFISRRKTAAT
jgi:hypothetical protein